MGNSTQTLKTTRNPFGDTSTKPKTRKPVPLRPERTPPRPTQMGPINPPPAPVKAVVPHVDSTRERLASRVGPVAAAKSLLERPPIDFGRGKAPSVQHAFRVPAAPADTRHDPVHIYSVKPYFVSTEDGIFRRAQSLLHRYPDQKDVPENLHLFYEMAVFEDWVANKPQESVPKIQAWLVQNPAIALTVHYYALAFRAYLVAHPDPDPTVQAALLAGVSLDRPDQILIAMMATGIEWATKMVGEGGTNFGILQGKPDDKALVVSRLRHLSDVEGGDRFGLTTQQMVWVQVDITTLDALYQADTSQGKAAILKPGRFAEIRGGGNEDLYAMWVCILQATREIPDMIVPEKTVPTHASTPSSLEVPMSAQTSRTPTPDSPEVKVHTPIRVISRGEPSRVSTPELDFQFLRVPADATFVPIENIVPSLPRPRAISAPPILVPTTEEPNPIPERGVHPSPITPDPSPIPSQDPSPIPSPNPSPITPDPSPVPSPNPSPITPDPSPIPSQDPSPIPSQNPSTSVPGPAPSVVKPEGFWVTFDRWVRQRPKVHLLIKKVFGVILNVGVALTGSRAWHYKIRHRD